jgi:hypothetical protein
MLSLRTFGEDICKAIIPLDGKMGKSAEAGEVKGDDADVRPVEGDAGAMDTNVDVRDVEGEEEALNA